MKFTHLFAFIMIFVVGESALYAQETLTAKEIIEKADEKIRGKTNKSVMEMQIIRPTWQRDIAMKSWANGLDYSMTYITSPARDKGQVFMKRKTEMWNWMPSIGRMIKIPASMMSQGWMGSDYTNDDILKESSIVVDYNHSLEGEEEVEGLSCYKIEMQPKEEAAVIWGKVYKWITKDEFIQIKSEYFDEDEELVKSDFGYDFKKMDGRLIPTRIEIVPAGEEGKKTVLFLKEIEFDIEIDDSYFSQQNMKRIR
ncbi:outer membrane lipoprotein-sorting protein [Lutimonas zeaxanthinifaciens]|uniref:outer membrane lipoprotein-sorting protein n=1 Tax=Lutimonas zeaxanthinifaciens TaxID=3060215 RepID=UPI00265D25BD|nr:outer membrane lipoprotein-sorting protein [Lutimonas sp. YSD2104]WKK65250.1 outer membrane lipoprotein-sorting protein [Lutimonas sp. YSD2104]